MTLDYLHAATFKRGWSARAVLAAAVIGILVPTLTAAGWLANRSADSERAQIELNVQQRAHEISAILDREVIGIKSMLAALAMSNSLHNGNLANFHAKAKEISEQLGLHIALFDAQSKSQILNTIVPFGAPVEGGGILSEEKRNEVLATDAQFVSNLFYGSRMKHYAIAVIQPVRLGGRQVLLAAAITDDRVREVFRLVQLDGPYTASVVDRAGVVIARSRDHETIVGKSLPPHVIAKLEHGAQGIFSGTSLAHGQFRWFYQRSPVTEWTVFVGAPADIFNSPVWSMAKLLAAAALLLFAAGLTIAYRVGGRFSRAVLELGSVARDLAHQAPPNSVSPSLRETDQLLDDLKAASLDLRFADSQQRFAIEAAGIGTWRWDIVHNRLIWSRRTREIYRLPDGEPTIEHFMNALHPDDRELVRQNMQECLRGTDHYEIEFRALAEDGVSYRWLNGKGRVERDASGATLSIQGAVQDITERKQNEEERDHLRRQLMTAQEQERLRLAHELHDQTGQSLTAALLEVKQIELSTGQNSRSQIDRLRGRLEEIGTTVHRIAHELRPTAIEDLGLRAALANHLSEWSRQYNVPSDFHFLCSDPDASPDALLRDEAKTAVYRIAQEALTNVAKHAKRTSAVGVILNCNTGLLQLTIADNGCGFDMDARAGGDDRTGLGLAGMCERAALIGGTLEIETSPDAGTTVFLRVPVEARRRVA